MPNNRAFDARLLAEALRLVYHDTNKETAIAALTERRTRSEQRELLALFGEIDYDPGYEYNQERHSKRD